MPFLGGYSFGFRCFTNVAGVLLDVADSAVMWIVAAVYSTHCLYAGLYMCSALL